MGSKERIEKALKEMGVRRDSLLNDYLLSIEKPVWDHSTSMEAVNAAGRLNDCDRHITNLQLEMKRAATEKKEVAHAS
jgi:hypothetical protein